MKKFGKFWKNVQKKFNFTKKNLSKNLLRVLRLFDIFFKYFQKNLKHSKAKKNIFKFLRKFQNNFKKILKLYYPPLTHFDVHRKKIINSLVKIIFNLSTKQEKKSPWVCSVHSAEYL